MFALLIHLGYLAFDHDRREVYIPNEEVRSEFVNAIEGSEWNTVVNAISASDKLLRATLKKEEELYAVSFPAYFFALIWSMALSAV